MLVAVCTSLADVWVLVGRGCEVEFVWVDDFDVVVDVDVDGNGNGDGVHFKTIPPRPFLTLRSFEIVTGEPSCGTADRTPSLREYLWSNVSTLHDVSRGSARERARKRELEVCSPPTAPPAGTLTRNQRQQHNT